MICEVPLFSLKLIPYLQIRIHTLQDIFTEISQLPSEEHGVGISINPIL